MQNQTKVRNVKSLMRDVKKGSYDLNHPVQRKAEQWGKDAKEMLFDSINKNIVILPIVFAIKDGTTFVVDGKQRLSILDEYINKKDTKLTFNGLKFDELDEDTKDKILSAEITTIIYTECTDEDIFELFERYNNGVALSGSQKSRSYCSMAILSQIKELLAHPFIEKCNISKGQELKSEDEICILQAAMVVGGFEFKNFSNKEIDRYLKDTDEKDVLAHLDALKGKLDILDGIVEEKQKVLKKIHLPAIIACANDTEEFKNKLLNFLENYANETDYRSFCQGATSQKENVMGRLNYWK